MLDATQRILGTLTMARKAGKLTLGFDAVKDTLTAKTAEIVLVTADISSKTEKEIRFFCGRTGVDIEKTAITMEDCGHAFGRKSGVMSVTDRGLAGLVKKIQNEHRHFTEEKI
jgi:ribosomal protein L7Ae-like RNA K-turn-binding protein